MDELRIQKDAWFGAATLRTVVTCGRVMLGQDYRRLEWPDSRRLMIGYWVAIRMRQQSSSRQVTDWEGEQLAGHSTPDLISLPCSFLSGVQPDPHGMTRGTEGGSLFYHGGLDVG